jgi:WD40 repeat protein
LITGSADRSIRSWDISTGEEIAVFAGHNNSITSLARSPETQRLATSDADGEVRIWDTTRSNLRSRLQGNLLDQKFERILQLKTAGGGRLVATCDQFTGVALWTAATRFSTADSFRGDPTLFTNAFDISPDDSTLATVGGTSSPVQRAADQDRGEVLLWEIASGRVKQRLRGHRGSVMCARFSPDGKSLATGGSDTSVIVWSVETGKPWKWGALREHFGTVTTLAFSADGTMLATGARGGKLLGRQQDGNFKVWDLPDNPQAREKPLVSRVTREGFGPRGVEQIAFLPDSKSLLVSSSTTVGLWDAVMFKQRFSVPGRFFDIAPDGTLFCSGGGKDLLREARLWETASGKEVRKLVGGHVVPVSAVAFKGDQRVITGSYGGRVAYWDTGSGQELLNLND